jgi:hypothetical protein
MFRKQIKTIVMAVVLAVVAIGAGGMSLYALAGFGSPPADKRWHRFAQNRLLAVDIERCLYEVKGEKRFLMAVRLTNLTDTEIGVDLRGKRPGIYPNQWGVYDTMKRGIIDERRLIHTEPDPDKLRGDFKTGLLTAIPAGKSTIVYTDFNSSGRADVDGGKGKHFIVSMDGQIPATDGKAVDTISCTWKDKRGTAETDVVLPFPVIWREAPAGIVQSEPERQ